MSRLELTNARVDTVANSLLHELSLDSSGGATVGSGEGTENVSLLADDFRDDVSGNFLVALRVGLDERHRLYVLQHTKFFKCASYHLTISYKSVGNISYRVGVVGEALEVAVLAVAVDACNHVLRLGDDVSSEAVAAALVFDWALA